MLVLQWTPEERVADRLISALNHGDEKLLVSLVAPESRDALSAEYFGALSRKLAVDVGTLRHAQLISLGPQGHAQFLVQTDKGETVLDLTVDATLQVLDFSFAPPPAEQGPIEDTRATLELPLTGEWMVLSGGDTRQVNKHVHDRSQRRAVDLVKVDSRGQTHKGQGTSNLDYYAFDQPVLSAGMGTVVTVIDGVPDNAPGSPNPYSALGNTVIIQHGVNEFGVYAHLLSRSTKVRPGALVQMGEEIARCGNSGDSSAPQLHFHMQDGPNPQDASGLQAVISNVFLKRPDTEGKQGRYLFWKGDFIRR